MSRTAEQTVLGLGSLLLARIVGLDDFAPISVMLILNSVALTLSDFGLGTDALRLEVGRLASLRELRGVRLRNMVVVVVCAVGGTAIGGDAGIVLAGGGVLWAASAESFIRRSAALRGGAVRSVVRAELAGATVLALSIAGAAAVETDAVALFSLGLVLKQIVELSLVRAWRPQFGDTDPVRDTRLLWWAQAVAYAVANVDYLVLGLLQPGNVFSIYVLAFRLANSLPSQLSFVAGRILSVDLATADPEARQAVFQRFTRTLFLLGVPGALAVAALAPILPGYLGDEWRSITWVLVALACSLPWRMVLGVAGTLTVVLQRSHQLLRLELAHLALLVGACVMTAGWGLQPFVTTVSCSTVLANLAYHRLAARLAGIRWWPPLVPLAVASLAIIVAAGGQISSP